MPIPPLSICLSGTDITYTWFGENTELMTSGRAVNQAAARFLEVVQGQDALYEPSALAAIRGEFKSVLRRAMSGKLRANEVRDSQNNTHEPLYEIRWSKFPVLRQTESGIRDLTIEIRHYHSERRGYDSEFTGHAVLEKRVLGTDFETWVSQDNDIEEVLKIYKKFRSL